MKKIKNFIKKIKTLFCEIIPNIKIHFSKIEYGIDDHFIIKDKKIVVSLTSFPARFPNLFYCLKSILNQKTKPNKIILYLDDFVLDEQIPKNILELKKKGLEIKKVPFDLKPHNKYLFAMKEFPNDIIITLDDDCIYRKNTISLLIKSYRKYPNCVSCLRAHEITFKKDGMIDKYNDWIFEQSSNGLPSENLLATGVGDVLYPPNIFKNEDFFNVELIKKICHKADDIWLKYNQILNNVLVVLAAKKSVRPILIWNSQNVGLFKSNVCDNSNDDYVEKIEKHFQKSFFS